MFIRRILSMFGVSTTQVMNTLNSDIYDLVIKKCSNATNNRVKEFVKKEIDEILQYIPEDELRIAINHAVAWENMTGGFLMMLKFFKDQGILEPARALFKLNAENIYSSFLPHLAIPICSGNLMFGNDKNKNNELLLSYLTTVTANKSYLSRVSALSIADSFIQLERNQARTSENLAIILSIPESADLLAAGLTNKPKTELSHLEYGNLLIKILQNKKFKDTSGSSDITKFLQELPQLVTEEITSQLAEQKEQDKTAVNILSLQRKQGQR